MQGWGRSYRGGGGSYRGGVGHRAACLPKGGPMPPPPPCHGQDIALPHNVLDPYFVVPFYKWGGVGCVIRGGVGWVMKGWGRVGWVGHKGWGGVGGS